MKPAKGKQKIDIEALLVWAYRDCCADRIVGRVMSRLRPAGARSGMGAFEAKMMLGVQVDCFGSAAMGSDELHPDAEAVHDAVMGLEDRNAAALVIECARTASRPTLEVAPRIEKRIGANGKPMRGEFGECLILLHGTEAEVKYRRRVFGMWVEALEMLALRLGGLVEHEVSGPAVMAALKKSA